MQSEIASKKTKQKTMQLLPIALLLILIGALSFLTYYFYSEYTTLKNNPNKIVEDEITAITSKISVFMVLPSDETPNIATVEDPSLLQDQDFFKNAEQGDKVLLYAKSLKAILYRPATNQVIEVAPLVLDTTAGPEGGLPTDTTEPPTEEIITETPEVTEEVDNPTPEPTTETEE